MGSLHTLNIPAGAQLMVGRAKVPMSAEVAEKLGALVKSVKGISEAHLPLVWASGYLDTPKQVLVIVIAPGFDASQALASLGRGLDLALAPGTTIDVWPLHTESGLLPSVRAANCPLG